MVCKEAIGWFVNWILIDNPKGHVSVIARNPPCKDGNAPFTIAPLNHILIKCSRYLKSG